MKLQKLTLNHFSSHVATTMEFTKPITMIVGTLGAGKSSVAQAIEYALTGECGTYRKRTDDRKELIHDLTADRPGMTVDLWTDKGRATRGRSDAGESLAWNEKTQENAGVMDTVVQAAIGTSKAFLAATTNVSNFCELDPTVQKELIIGLIGAEVTPEKIKALYTGEPEALALLQGPVGSLQAIQNAYDYVFARRTVVKRELKELKPPPAPEGQAPPLDKIRALLVQLETEVQSKIADRARLDGAAQAIGIQQQLRQKRETLAHQVKDGRPNADHAASLMKLVNDAKDARVGAAEMAKAMEQKLRTVMADAMSREQNIKLLRTFNGRCVAGDHACPAPVADMQKALAEQEATYKRLCESGKKLEAEAAMLSARRDDPKPVEEAAERYRAFEQTIRTYDQATLDLPKIDQEIAKVGQIVGDPEKMKLLDGEVQTLRDRITKGRQQLESARAWLERERAVKLVAEQRAKLERELTSIEDLVEFFGPKGVKVQLLDERIGQFEMAINEHLVRFGFELRMQLDPWRLYVAGRPISRLSRSERFRLGIAFQIALAKMTGLGLVVVDDAELLTPEVRGTMMQLLATSGLDQAIVILTLMDVPQFMAVRAKLPPVIDVFMVENKGGVSEVRTV